jgi:hypothetical protein
MIFVTLQNKSIKLPEDDADALKHVDVTLYKFDVLLTVYHYVSQQHNQLDAL